jgi:hypothetical protein
MCLVTRMRLRIPSPAAPSFLGAVFVVECRLCMFVASEQPLPGGSTHLFLGIAAFLCPPSNPVGGKSNLIVASQVCDPRFRFNDLIVYHALEFLPEGPSLTI